MALMSLLTLPVLSLLGLSNRVYQANQANDTADYTRFTAADAAEYVLGNAIAVTRTGRNLLQVQLSTGQRATLRLQSRQLLWIVGGARQVLALNIAAAEFRVLSKGSDNSEGTIVEMQLATQADGESNLQWTSSRLWIRDAI